jgi:hypothetical protein
VRVSAEQQVRAERVAALLVRLIRDPAFRADFRRRPAEEARAFGLDDLAGELRERHKALQTIEIRESTSGLAGLLLAAAAEGRPMVEVARHTDGPVSSETVRAARRALTRAGLPALAPSIVPAPAGDLAPAPGPWPPPEEGHS